MYEMVIDYLRKNDKILQGYPGYKEKYEAFLKLHDEIIAASKEQNEYSVRGSILKSQRRKELETKILDVSRKLKAYAMLENNNGILVNSSFPQWQVVRMKQFDLMAAAGNLIRIAQEHISKLEPYGITPGILRNLNESHDDYYSLISEPRTNEVNSSVATKKIAGAFKEADETLEFIDLIAAIAGDSYPEFYSGYRFVRRQEKKGSVKMALKANAIDKATGEPVPNVQFIFTLTEPVKQKTKKLYKVVKKTKKLGGLKIMHMPKGKYEVLAGKSGYREIKMTMVIKGSELVKLVAEMERMIL
jgi:hypothetical protein